MSIAPQAVVDRNLLAYNSRNLEDFMACLAQDIEVWDQGSGACVLHGVKQVGIFYAELFANSPQLHSRVLRRSVVGTVVVDHEIVTGRQGGDVEILITYQVVAGRIARIWRCSAPRAAVNVRRAGSRDVDTVAHIGRDTYVEHFAHIWLPDGLQAHIEREFASATIAAELQVGNVTYFLAESAGATLGFAKLRHPRVVPLQPSRSGAELQKIYVRGNTLRQGIGVQLLDACVLHATQLGLELLWLDVLERNTQATCFYLRHGFTFLGKESFQTDRALEVMLVMIRTLPK